MEILEAANSLVDEWDSICDDLTQKLDNLRPSSAELLNITNLIKSINSSCELIKLKPSSGYLFHINSRLIEQRINEVKKSFISLRDLNPNSMNPAQITLRKQQLLDECYHNFNCILIYLSNLRNASPEMVKKALGNTSQDTHGSSITLI